MKKNWIFFALMFVTIAPGADVFLRGRVLDAFGFGIVDVQVSLLDESIQTLSDTGGLYLLEKSVPVTTATPLQTTFQFRILGDGSLELFLDRSGPVRLMAFDLRARSEVLLNLHLDAGNYRIPLSRKGNMGNQGGIRFYQIKGPNFQKTFKWVALENSPLQRENTLLNKRAAVIDTILFFKSGYLPLRLPIENLLDSLADVMNCHEKQGESDNF